MMGPVFVLEFLVSEVGTDGRRGHLVTDVVIRPFVSEIFSDFFSRPSIVVEIRHKQFGLSAKTLRTWKFFL